MSESTNIYIDGEHAATIKNLQHDVPWHYGTLIPGDTFEELKESLDVAPWAKGDEGTVELVARQDTVERVSWGSDVDTSEMISKLTLARYAADGPWELEFTCEGDDAGEPVSSEHSAEGAV